MVTAIPEDRKPEDSSYAATTVWCASYPKSGNTWLRALISGAVGDGTVRLKNLSGQAAGNDQAEIFREFGLTPSVLNDEMSYALMDEVAASVAQRSATAVFRKTHNRFRGDPPRGANHSLRVPVQGVYVVRDPRAVAVSLAHHLGCSHTQAVEVMTSGPQVPHQDDRYAMRSCRVAFDWGSWSENVTSWLEQTEVPVTVITYEEMSANTHKVMAQVLTKLRLTVPAQRLDQAIAESSFDQLAVQEMIEGFSEASAADRQFFRSGRTDAWRQELAPDLVEQIQAVHGDAMQRLGYLP